VKSRHRSAPTSIPLLSWTFLTSEEIARFSGFLDQDGGQQDTVDELGFDTIRAFYSELFFPGITTLFSRARYFFLVPYLLSKAQRFTQSGRGKDRDWYAQFRSWEKAINQHFRRNKDKERPFVGERTVDRSFSEIYWGGLLKLGLIGDRYDGLSLRECIRELGQAGQAPHTDDLDPLEERSLLKDTEIIRISELEQVLAFNGVDLKARALDKLSLELSRAEAEFLSTRLTGLNMSPTALKANNLWASLIKRTGRFSTRDESREYQGDWGNIHELATDTTLQRFVKDALLISRLARTMYIAYWYHVLQPAPVKWRKNCRDLCEQGMSLLDELRPQAPLLTECVRSTVSRLPMQAAEYGIEAGAVHDRTIETLTAWISLLDSPKDAFGSRGHNLLRNQEVHTKTIHRARLASSEVPEVNHEQVLHNQLNNNGKYQYPFRFQRAVTIAFDISQGLKPARLE
jgi:hypothetical protein